MSTRTAQCRECTDVFECGPTGRLPVLCPKCRKEPAPAKPRKRASAASNGNGSGSIHDALALLRTDLGSMQTRAAQLEEAIEALEKLA